MKEMPIQVKIRQVCQDTLRRSGMRQKCIFKEVERPHFLKWGFKFRNITSPQPVHGWGRSVSLACYSHFDRTM